MVFPRTSLSRKLSQFHPVKPVVVSTIVLLAMTFEAIVPSNWMPLFDVFRMVLPERVVSRSSSRRTPSPVLPPPSIVLPTMALPRPNDEDTTLGAVVVENEFPLRIVADAYVCTYRPRVLPEKGPPEALKTVAPVGITQFLIA